MGHECPACGETFATLTRLRLHDCPAAAPDDSLDADLAAFGEWLTKHQYERSEARRRRGRRAVSEQFAATLERASDGGPEDAFTLVARFEQELDAAIDRDDDGDTFRDVFWAYYEPVTEVLDAVARAEGWSFLLDLVDAYDPDEQWYVPVVSEPIANAVGRSLIRTRFTREIAAVPPEALDYLAAIPEFEDESGDTAWEESIHYGWGIGHPERSVAETILEITSYDVIWASAAAQRALYADQHAAVDLFVDLVREAGDDDLLVIEQLSTLEGDPSWEMFPRYWDVHEEFDRDFAFTFDDDVAQRLRAVVEEVGIANELPADWTFADLEFGWGPPL